MTHNRAKQNTKNEKPLSEVVLQRIAEEQVQPVGKAKFLLLNWGIWVAWALTVTIGAISVAVMIFVGGHARFALHEATHDTPLSFFVEVLPYLWVAIFALMAILAYVNMRHTKTGYRYQVTHILVSSLLFSVAGGVVLHIFGTGHMIDSGIGKRMPLYTSYEKIEERLWQRPEQGRLVGTFVGMDETETLYIFKDAAHATWTIQTLELRNKDKRLLSSGRAVRVLGTTTDEVERSFYACGVFPWMFTKNLSMHDIRSDRKEFISRMYEHMETADRLRTLEEETYGKGVPMPFEKGKCGELAMMKRMKF